MGPLNKVTTSTFATKLDTLNEDMLNMFKLDGAFDGPVGMLAFKGDFISVGPPSATSTKLPL